MAVSVDSIGWRELINELTLINHFHHFCLMSVVVVGVDLLRCFFVIGHSVSGNKLINTKVARRA